MLAMRLFVLAFASGVWLLQQQAALPSATVACSASALAAVLDRLALAEASVPEVGFGSYGASSRTCDGSLSARGRPRLHSGRRALPIWRLAEELPKALEGQDIEVSGVVAGLPQELERGVRFAFDVEQALPGVPSRVSLAWYRGT
jgi:competence protein ComEC